MTTSTTTAGRRCGRSSRKTPLGRDIDDAVAKVQDRLAVIGDEILTGYDWLARRAAKGPKAPT